MKKNDLINVIEILKQTYPDAKCSLDFSTPFEILVAVVLSAQCTDERVNKTTPALFASYSTPADFHAMPLETLEALIHPCGFYKTKAKNLKATAAILVEKYNGIVPDDMETLITLPGVGRKSANVIMLEAFHKPQGVAIDTHAKRICNRLGISKETEPSKIEQDLLKHLPKQYYEDVNHLFVWHGRNTCMARTPNCAHCSIKEFCKEYKKSHKSHV